MTVRAYDSEPTPDELKESLENWVDLFPCTKVSENMWSFGYDEVKNLPKNREEALSRHTKACAEYYKANDKRRLAARLLALAPFNGSAKD